MPKTSSSLTHRPLVLAAHLFMAAAAALLLAGAALADEAAIRKNLPERVPNLPPIDEVIKSPIPGLYEVRIGSSILYADETANHVIEGSLIDARTRTNLTEARLNKLSAVDFDKLPLKDAIVWKNGTGARKLAVFSDPNCGYCKKLEVDLQKLKNVTVYTFLVPMLGPDSAEKSKNIWCAKDQARAWLGWMLEARLPARHMTACETPLERNMAFSRKHRVNGTPALFFADDTRVPGAIEAEEIEKRLSAAHKS
jgi:thiol:disulfide interchange protein DsbC